MNAFVFIAERIYIGVSFNESGITNYDGGLYGTQFTLYDWRILTNLFIISSLKTLAPFYCILDNYYFKKYYT